MNSENAGIRMALKFMFGPHAKEANQALREILARTPIFGGTAQAALDSDGGRLAYLSFSPNSTVGKAVSVDLPKAVSDVSEMSLVHASSAAKPIDVQLDKVAGASFARPTIGFIAPAGHKGDALAETMIISPGMLMTEQGTSAPCKDSWGPNSDQKDAQGGANRNSLLLVSPDSSIRTLDLRLGGFGRGAQFPLQVDFANNSFRVTSMTRSGGLPATLCLLSFQAIQSDEATQVIKGAIGLKSCARYFFHRRRWIPGSARLGPDQATGAPNSRARFRLRQIRLPGLSKPRRWSFVHSSDRVRRGLWRSRLVKGDQLQLSARQQCPVFGRDIARLCGRNRAPVAKF